MNPDTGYPFNTCGEYNGPAGWKPNLAQSWEALITTPNLKAQADAALERQIQRHNQKGNLPPPHA